MVLHSFISVRNARSSCLQELHPFHEDLATTRDFTSHTSPSNFMGRFFEVIRDIGIPDNIDPSAALALDVKGRNIFSA